MTWRPGPKLPVYVALVSAGFVTGLASGRVESVVLVAPLALAIAMGLAATQPVALDVTVELGKTRVTEGDTVALNVTVTTPTGLPRLEVALDVPAELAVSEPGPARGLALRAGEQRRLGFALQTRRWGSYELGEVVVRARSPLGLLESYGHYAGRLPLVVYPRPETLRRLVAAHHTQTAPGLHFAPVKGEGIEFADARPFVTGDRVREINWRISARRGAPWVNQRHPERSTDLVVFLDTFGEATLPAASRAANALVAAYLGQRDRVGLIGFGGVLRWVRPGTGLRQQYLVIDALLAARTFPSVAWKGITLLPPRVLPPRALVVALSPLEDDRALTALMDLRDRGIDLVIIEVSPVVHVPAPTDQPEALAQRLWRLRRAVLRDRYRDVGIPTVEWREGTPLATAIEEVRAWPRGSRRAG
jgi:uncharacterized protein (DUF58 family)